MSITASAVNYSSNIDQTTESSSRLHAAKTQRKVSNIASDEDIMENDYMFVMLWNLSVISHLIFPQCFV